MTLDPTPNLDSDPEDPETAGRDATPRHELWLYAGAALSYIVVGFMLKQIFAWWWFGAAWFIAYVWIVPNLRDRFRSKTPAEPGATS